jgi:hypothetical protein
LAHIRRLVHLRQRFVHRCRGRKKPQPFDGPGQVKQSGTTSEFGSIRSAASCRAERLLSGGRRRPRTCSFTPKICSLKPRQDLPETFLERSGCAAHLTLLTPHERNDPMPTRLDLFRLSAFLRRSEAQPEEQFVHSGPSSARLCGSMLTTTVNFPTRRAPSPQIRARDTSLDGTTNGSAGVNSAPNVDAGINGATHLGEQRCGDHGDRGHGTNHRKLAEHKIATCPVPLQ